MKFIVKYAGVMGISLIILLLILAKLPDLSLPYFWDELGVYAPGALTMKDTGHFGLLPRCLDPELSRGHPLLAYFGYALFYRFFGDGVISGHSFSLLLGCGTLLACYGFIRESFGRITALLCCLLLAVQPLFFAMAGIVMPEMMLTLFAILAIWGLVSGRWWLYVLSAVCCVLIKESGIVIPATALLLTGIQALRQRQLFTLRVMGHLGLCFVPLLAFVGFLLIQKQQHGWYFFPLHASLMRFNLPSIRVRAYWILHFLFLGQGRMPLAFFVGFALVAAFLKPAYTVVQQRAILVCVLFLIVATGFAAPNYYLVRYILYALPFGLMLAAIGLVRVAAYLPKVPARLLLAVAAAGGLAMGIWNLYPKHFGDNADMSYKYLVQTQRQCIRWAENQPWRDSVITSNFPVYQALKDRRNGYLKVQKAMTTISLEGSMQRTRYGIYYWQGGKLPIMNIRQCVELMRFRQNDAIFSVLMKLE